MLNWNQVVRYIKANLNLPSNFFEDDDSTILDYLKETALLEFSTYIPDIERTAIDTTDEQHIVSGSTKKYYFFDEEDCDIISVVECYFPLGDHALIGHPLVGPTTFSNMSSWATQVFKAKTFGKFSMFDRTYKYIPPNVIELRDANFLTSLEPSFLVEYERVQPADLSRIPAAMNMTFKDLCLAHYMLKIGNMRSTYGDNIDTPFGTIPLKGEEIRSRGDELRQKVVDILKEESMPPIFIAIN